MEGKPSYRIAKKLISVKEVIKQWTRKKEDRDEEHINKIMKEIESFDKKEGKGN